MVNGNDDGERDEEVFLLYSAADFVAKQQLAQQQARSFSIAKNTFSYPKGSQIFKEGDMGDAMFILLEGEVHILKSLTDGSSRVLHTMRKGDFFGEMSLIDRKKRSASAVVAEECTLVRIPEEFMLRFIEKNPQFVIKMLNTFVSRLRQTNALIERTMMSNPQDVILAGLKEYAASHGDKVYNGTKVNVRDFAFWANYRLGVPEARIPAIVDKLAHLGRIRVAAHGPDEVIVAL